MGAAAREGRQAPRVARPSQSRRLAARVRGSGAEKRSPPFRSAIGRTGALSGRPLLERNALDLVQRRARQAGIATAICNHTFRPTGITAYLENGGTLEKVQAIAAHESPRTTKLYDRSSDRITLDEIERIIL